MKIHVSIIVPIYNAELYLKKCINSLINQTLKNIEIILINDGSTDNSAKICKDYALNDNRIIYVETLNGGVSRARNTGVAQSKARWVTFVDADDWVEPYYCEKLLSYTNENVDTVMARTFTFMDGKILEDGYRGIKAMYFRDNVEKYPLYVSIVNDSNKVRVYPHLATCSAKLFKKKLLLENNITYNEQLKYYEDAIFNMNVIACSDTVCIAPDVLYYYRMHNSSSTKIFRDDTIQYYENAYIELKEFLVLNNINLDNDIHMFNIKNLDTIFTNYFRNISNWKDQNDFVSKVCNKPLYKKTIKKIKILSLPTRRRILLVLFARIRFYAFITYLYNRRRFLPREEK